MDHTSVEQLHPMNGDNFVLGKKLVPVNFDPAFQDYIKHLFFMMHIVLTIYISF